MAKGGHLKPRILQTLPEAEHVMNKQHLDCFGQVSFCRILRSVAIDILARQIIKTVNYHKAHEAATNQTSTKLPQKSSNKNMVLTKLNVLAASTIFAIPFFGALRKPQLKTRQTCGSSLVSSKRPCPCIAALKAPFGWSSSNCNAKLQHNKIVL